jgi:hypothetical protein
MAAYARQKFPLYTLPLWAEPEASLFTPLSRSFPWHCFRFCSEQARAMAVGGIMLSQTSPIGMSPGVSMPSQDLEKVLQPFLDELHKDFADMLTALVQELLEDARAGGNTSNTCPTAPAAAGVPAGRTPPRQPSRARDKCAQLGGNWMIRPL